MKKRTQYLIIVLGIICLVYYSLKFYMNKFISIDSAPMGFWVVIFLILILSLLLGVYNVHINSKILKENKEIKESNIEILKENSEMKDLLNQLYDKLSDNHEETVANQDDIMETILNSRDVTIDTYNHIKRGE